ncbi:RraA family protein [Candidatus Latescibacterota bacterium]
MSNNAINNSRRKILKRGASLLGAGIGGSMISPLVAGCDNTKQSRAGGTSRYLKYKDKLDQCFSAVLQDVMDGMNLRVQCMDPSINPLTPNMKAWGEAVTIYVEEVAEVPEHPFQMEMELLDDTVEGQIIIAQCNARSISAFWGGLLSNAAVGHKVSGIIIDGGARDYDEIVELDFPVFCKGLSPYDSLGRMDGKERDIPIECGGVRVVPGDLVFGDVDGIVVVPQEVVDEVIAKSWEKVQAESTVREELRSGASVVETFKKHGVL